MAEFKAVKAGQIYMGKLAHGADLLEELNGFCRERGIRLGRIEGLGAVKVACLGFYDQQSFEYRTTVVEKPMEITNLVGNVSIKDGEPFVHAHVTLLDENHQSYGGHLMPGTVVFACEVIMESFDGPDFERGLDAQTGLPLWRF